VSEPEAWLAKALSLEENLTGDEDESDTEQEIENLLRRAADAGLPRAMAELGSFLWHVREDDDEAHPWLLRAAEHGEAASMSLLGDIHDFRDEADQAIAWYEKAAALGDESAAGNLAAYRSMGVR
jgi:TPR repeat protein